MLLLADGAVLPLSSSALSESVKKCGAEALTLLGQMKQQDDLAAADGSKLRTVLEDILATALVCNRDTREQDTRDFTEHHIALNK